MITTATDSTVELTIDGANVLSHSRIASFKTCQRLHFWRYELGFRPDRDAEPLRFGKVYHLGHEVLGNGGSLDDAVAAIRAEYANVPEWVLQQDGGLFDWMAECERCARLLCGYVWRWTNDTLKVLRAERTFNVPIRNPETGAATPVFTLGGKTDQVIELADGRLAVHEFKTTSEDIAPESNYWRHLRIDTQISTYMLAERSEGTDVQTVLYDVTWKPMTRPKLLTQAETAAFIQSGDYMGEKFGVANDGAGFIVDGERAQVKADGKKPAIRETSRMYGARLSADIADEPNHYYARREIPRLESDLEDYAHELWQIQQQIRAAQLNNRHFRNSAACFKWGRPCEFFELCSTGYKPNGSVPSGYRRAENIHEELTL